MEKDKLDREELKQPDAFQTSMDHVIKFVESHRTAVIVSIAVIVLLGFSVAMMAQYRNNKEKSASDALFQAMSLKKTDGQDLENQNKAFLDSIDGLLKNYNGTRASFDGAIEAGKLLIEVKFEKAIEYFKKAKDFSQDAITKAISANLLAYALEKKGQFKEATEVLSKSVDSEATPLKPEMMLNLARNYKLSGDMQKAKQTLEKVTTTFPETEYAKLAASYKNEIK